MQGSTDPINKVFSHPYSRYYRPYGGRASGVGWQEGGGFKPNGIKFIMFLKMSMFYIRGIIILARQRNNLRDTIMKSRDYTRRARAARTTGAVGGGVSVWAGTARRRRVRDRGKDGKQINPPF